MEKWAKINFESEYEYLISTDGRIKMMAHVRRWIDGRHHNIPDRIIKTCKTPRTGYECVVLYSRPKVKTQMKVHRLMCLTFLDNPDNKPFVNHKDGDRMNNKLENLEWCTISENTLDSIKRGTWVHPNPPKLKK